MRRLGRMDARRSNWALGDRILANDPALTRFRMAARVTLTVIVTVLCLVLLHLAGIALPAVTYGLAIMLSVEGGVAVRDRLPKEQLKTRIAGSVVSFACVALAAALEDWRYISDPMFIVVIFCATVGRVYGPRGFAIGMFAFSSYFMGAYLKPKLGDLPLAAIGPAIALVAGHLVRTRLLPDDWRRDLLQSLIAVQGQVGDILAKLTLISRRQTWEEADRRELRRLEERLKDVVLMAEGFLPRPLDGALDTTDEPVTRLAMTIFDVHLAAESAIVLAMQAVPNVSGEVETQDEKTQESMRALQWLQKARAALAEAIEEGRATGFRAIADAQAPSDVKPDFSLKNSAIRAAIQITVASGVAMGFGLMLSRDRWFWAVLTAFLIFTNTKSRGDAAIRALQRSIGTLFGIGFGLVVATYIGDQSLIAVPSVAICIFLGFYFLQVSYAAMTFFISIVLCMIYGLMGTLTVDLLQLRIEETLIGAIAGTTVAFFVFSAPTRSALDLALDRWFSGLRQLLDAAREGGRGLELIELSRQVDVAYREVTVAARPLGTSWSVVTRPGHVRQTLVIFLAATYWARIFARNGIEAGKRPDGEVLAALEEAIALIDRLAPRGAECFWIKRDGTGTSAGRHLPIFKHGARVGIEMIGSMLGRLYPTSG